MGIDAVNRNRKERRRNSICKRDGEFDLRYKFETMGESHLKCEAKAQKRG